MFRKKTNGEAPQDVAYISVSEPNILSHPTPAPTQPAPAPSSGTVYGPTHFLSEPTPPATAPTQPAPIMYPARLVPKLQLQLNFRANSHRCAQMSNRATMRLLANQQKNFGGNFVDIEPLLRAVMQDRANEEE
jgi:hypothetical protein